MKRIVWITVLLASLLFAGKLALKQPPKQPLEQSPVAASDQSTPPHRQVAEQSDDSELLIRFADERELLTKLLDSYGHNARRIAASEGIRGLRLLNELGDLAVCLSDDRPDEFHRLCQVSGTDADAARLAGAWRHFFDPSQCEHEITARLASELSRLSARARRLAEQTPESLPFLLTDTRRVAELLDRLGPEALEPLAYIDLSDGGESLRRAVGVLDRHGTLAIEATGQLGPAGFLIVERYGPLVEMLRHELGLRRSLATVASAMDDLDQLLQFYRTRTIGDAILHLEHRGLLDAAAGTPSALRLAVEFGPEGERALEIAGAHGVQVIYGVYSEGRCRNAVVQAIARGGLPAAAAAEKHGRSQEFQRIVSRDGAAAIIAVASACSAEEARQFLAAKTARTWTESLAYNALRLAGDSGDKTIRMIDRDGLERAESVASSSVGLYQFLPLYDLSHLGAVVCKGYLPTRGEFVWAGMDAALVTVDVLSLMALQPEAVAASEAARNGVKSTARTTLKSGARAVVEQVTEGVAEHAASTTGRQLVRGTAEQLAEGAASLSTRAAETASAELAESLARRSGIRLVHWHSAAAGRLVLGRLADLPRNRLTKYVVANGAQAAVGLLAVRKMEEYLEGRGNSTKDR